jgi:hypothetical protein
MMRPTRAAQLFSIIADVRKVYAGPLTYSANWDDVEENALYAALDFVGINAFYRDDSRGGCTEGGRGARPGYLSER